MIIDFCEVERVTITQPILSEQIKRLWVVDVVVVLARILNAGKDEPIEPFMLPQELKLSVDGRAVAARERMNERSR